MKHFFLVVLIILVACAAYAQTGVPTPSEPRLMTGPDGALVSSTNPLPTTASIGSITVDAFPVYNNAAGENATATVDASNRVVVSDEGGAAILQPPTALPEATTVLAANTVTTIPPVAGRDWVTFKAYSTNTETIWISVNNGVATATVGQGDELAPGARITLRVPVAYTIGVIASAAETIHYRQEVR